MRTRNTIFMLVVWGLTMSSAQNIPTNGLVAYFPFNRNANDMTHNGHDCTVYNAVLAPDRFQRADHAYDFRGPNNYMKGSATGLPGAARGVSVWFYLRSVATHPVILGYGGQGSPGTSWWMSIDHGGTHAYFLGIHYDQSKYLSSAYAISPVGRWIHMVATTEPAGSKLYINGCLAASNAVFVNNTPVAGKDLSIGVDVDGYGRAPYVDSNVGYCDGAIDDIRIYDRCLTGSEVWALYKEEPTAVEDGSSMLPDRFVLEGPYPNPFNPSTRIRFAVASRSPVTIAVYTTLGQHVATVEQRDFDPGMYETEFVRQDLPSGMYYCRMTAGTFHSTTRMMLIR